MFRFANAGKRKGRPSYDTENTRPVIRASICTGEQVAGFKNIHTGKFADVMLIRGERDLAEFCREYGVDAADIVKEY